MPEKAVIDTAFPTLREAADTYGVSAKKLRMLVARFASVVQDGATHEPKIASQSDRGSQAPSRGKKRMRLQAAARRRAKSRRQKRAGGRHMAKNPAVV